MTQHWLDSGCETKVFSDCSASAETLAPHDYPYPASTSGLNNAVSRFIKRLGETRILDSDREDPLSFMRETTLTATATRPDGESSDSPATQAVAYSWLMFLTTRRGPRDNFFLQHFRARDEVFYDRETLRPKPRGEWEVEAWRKKLPWLKRPQNLTIAEMELALAIFDWGEEEGPRLTWWLRRYPHILVRVHSFLLQRYCFQLLKPLRRAMRRTRWDSAPKNDGENPHLYQKPFLASPAWRFYPRIAGLTALGALGVISLLEPIADHQLVLGSPGKTAGFALAFIGLLLLIAVDVFKHNQGLVARLRHALPRVVGVLWRMGMWSLIWAVPIRAVPFVFGRADVTQANLISAVWDALVMIAGTALIGALVQWIWEDTSAVEPI